MNGHSTVYEVQITGDAGSLALLSLLGWDAVDCGLFNS